MSKDSPFFKFDASDWLSGSIQFLGFSEKGLFIDLCAMYWKNHEPVKIDAKFKIRYNCDEGTLSTLIDSLTNVDLIIKSKHGITIPFLDKLMEDRQKWLKKCSEGGKKSSKSKGTSSNKKEERREEKEESRKKTKEGEKKEEHPPTGNSGIIECGEYQDIFELYDLWKPFPKAKQESVYRQLLGKFNYLTPADLMLSALSFEDELPDDWGDLLKRAHELKYKKKAEVKKIASDDSREETTNDGKSQLGDFLK